MSVKKQEMNVVINFTGQTESASKAINKLQTSLSSLGKNTSTSKINADITKIRNALGGLKEETVITKKSDFSIYNENLAETRRLIGEIENEIKKLKNLNDKDKIELFSKEDLETLKDLKASFEQLAGGKKSGIITDTKFLEQYQNFYKKITGHNVSSSQIKNISKNFITLENAIRTSDKSLDIFNNSIEKSEKQLQVAGEAVGSMGKELEKASVTFSGLSANTKEIDRLRTSLIETFSLSGLIRTFTRTLRDAFNTVKELDASMTETAVVTDFSIDDMWDKLPEYAEAASELGVSIKSMYDASTLYYQQGLETNEVMAMTTETLKMARIAGIEAAEATNYMTAAIRGFNMEINEMSAQKINDVYSELAAITAADTQQISVAMTKVASLANSANMEFETTAALLAQIIETTQESPETAGTALKTIVARFSEVKKLYSSGQLTGTDEEGEEIDLNKISEALRTVGIDMNEYFTGAKGLDDIFLELASKWDTLDLTQQRYIATQAAGSRQQSRFLAMMGNYDRTMELVEAAYNSTGASQEQFEKTLESLDAKLTRLKNAWDEFTMGLANSKVIKTVVDALANLLEFINKIIDTISGNSGILEMLITGGGTAATMAMGRKGVHSLLTGNLMSFITGDKKGVLEDRYNEFFGKKNGLTGLKGLFNFFAQEGLQRENRLTFANKYGELLKEAQIRGEKGNATLLAQKAREALNIPAELTGIEKIKYGFKGVGEVLKKSLLPKLATFGGYAAIFLAVASAIGSMGVAIYKVTHQAEILAKRAEEIKKGSQAAKQEIADLRKNLEFLSTKETNIDNLIKGTQEWRDAVAELNQQYYELMQQDPNMKQFISLDANGNYVLDKEGYQNYLDNRESQANENELYSNALSIEAAQIAKDQIIGKIDLDFTQTTGSLSQRVTLANGLKEELAEALANNNISTKEQLESWLQSKGYDNAEVSEEEWKKLSARTGDLIVAFGQLTQALNTFANKLGYGNITEQGYEELSTGKSWEELGFAGLSNKEIYDKITSEGNVANIVLQNYQEKEGLTEETAYAGITPWLDPSYMSLLKEAYSIQSTLTSAPKFDDELAKGEYARSSKEFNDLEKQTLNQNLRRMESAGIQLGSADVFEAANYVQEGKDIQEYIDSLIKLLSIENTHEKNVEDLTTTLESMGETSDEAASRAENLAKAWEEDQKEISKLQKIIKDTPDEHAKIAEAAKAAFDNDSIDTDFVDQHIDLFKRMAEGDAEAYEEIETMLINSRISELAKKDAEKAEALGRIVDEINGKNVNIGGTADFSQIFIALSALLDGAENAASFLEDMGYQVDWDVEWESFQIKSDNVIGDILNKGLSFIKVPKLTTVVTKTGLGPSGAGGGVFENTTDTSGGGGGGGGGSEEPWENSYDWLYNLTEDVNEELRKREKLENRYNQLLEDRKATAEDLYETSKLEIESLERQRQLQQEMFDKRRQEMKDYLNDNSSLSSYATFNWDDMTIEIDWEKIDSVTDQDTGDEIEEYISKLEEIQDQMDEAEDALLEIDNDIKEILDRGKEEYADLESRVLDALVAEDQRMIDELSAINDGINTANEKLINAINQNLEKYRQDRENQRTEENLSDTQQRLAYLRQDTSGANALEILQLEKQLAQDQESYTDTLIDQKISELEKQNEEAAEQRERQIELMESSLEYAQESGGYTAQIQNLISEAFGPNGDLLKNSQLVTLLKSTEGFEGMAHVTRMSWMDELTQVATQALGYISMNRQLEKIGTKAGTEITFTDGSGVTRTGKVDKDGNVVITEDDGGTTTYKDVYQDYSGAYKTYEESGIYEGKEPEQPVEPPKKSVGIGSLINASGATIYSNSYGGGASSQYYGYDPIYKIVGENNGYWLTRWHKLSSGYSGWFKKGSVTAYKTGGLADFTGLAQLDGTKAHPELVLNARDTENFIQLNDLLRDLKRTGQLGAGKGGDNYYNIEINVDELSNDYDVEQLGKKIKDMIVSDSMYRNVNTINLLR